MRSWLNGTTRVQPLARVKSSSVYNALMFSTIPGTLCG
jgi:hypothetical protein